MDLVRNRIDDAFLNGEHCVITKTVCDLMLKDVGVRCVATEIYVNDEYYWSLEYIVNGYSETKYNKYVEFMYQYALETAKRIEEFTGDKINIWRY